MKVLSKMGFLIFAMGLLFMSFSLNVFGASGIIEGKCDSTKLAQSQYRVWIEWESIPDYSKNQSLVTAKLYSQTVDSYPTPSIATYNIFDPKGSVWQVKMGNPRSTISINGVSKTESKTYDFRNHRLVEYATNSIIVPHNADGTKSIEITGNIQNWLGQDAMETGSVRGTVTLDTIGKNYTLKLDGNGNTNSLTPPILNGVGNTPLTLPANPYVKTGYTFEGWSLNRLSETPSYLDCQRVSFNPATNNSQIILYAIWKKEAAKDIEISGITLSHTPVWEENRNTFNQYYGGAARGPNVFWPGEKIVVQVDLEEDLDSCTAELSGTSYSTNLIKESSGSWKGTLWNKGMYNKWGNQDPISKLVNVTVVKGEKRKTQSQTIVFDNRRSYWDFHRTI